MSLIYDYYVTQYSSKFKRVLIDRNECERIKVFAKYLAEAKANEKHHLKDNGQAEKRFITGTMGEAALEKLFGIDIIDWSIGESAFYHNPDVPNYNVGIKTVEQGKFPIIFKNNDYPQIICIRSEKIDNLIFVCGLATPAVLNRYQSDDLILSDNLRARGTKTAFFGFSELRQVNSLDDIEKYKKNDNFEKKRKKIVDICNNR